MTKKIYNVDDVFGVSRGLPLNYVSREKVDESFVNHIAEKRNIVIFGSSKQGKTSLRKKWLDDDDYIVVSSSNRWGIAELNAAILKQAGFRTEQSTSKTLSGQAKIYVQVEGEAGIPFVAKTKGEGGVEVGGEILETVESAPLEIDPTDPNDIIKCLATIGFEKYIVLEDFHYLPEDTQRNFAFDLKTYHENSHHTFVVVGVWREKNRLIGYNGDLTERVISIDADTWSPQQLIQVVEEGEKLLNIEVSPDFRDKLVENSFESVHLVQEACRRVCRNENITSTQKVKKLVGSGVSAVEMVSEIVSDQSGRYMGFLNNVSEGFQETSKEMPKWVIYAILKTPLAELRKGLRLTAISQTIKSKHPDGKGLNNGNITQILQTFSSLQSKKNIRPIVADYDTQNRALYIVDRGFEIWLGTQDRNELLEELGLPLD